MKQLLHRSMDENMSLEMIYLGNDGKVTQRIIKVLEIHPDYIKAYCFLRHKKRTFRLSNILSIDMIRRRRGA